MVRDAEAHADEDKQRREEIEVKNQADSLAYSIERQLAEHGDKVAAADKAAIEEAIKEVRAGAQGQRHAAGQAGQRGADQGVAQDGGGTLPGRPGQGSRREADPAPGGAGNGRTKTAEGEVVDAEFEDLGPEELAGAGRASGHEGERP